MKTFLVMNSVQWIVKFSTVSQNIKLTSKMMNSKTMNSVLMIGVWWIVFFQSLGNDLKWRVVTVFPSKRNFVPKFSLCWSLRMYWWKGDDIREFQRTLTIGIRLCFNCLTTRSMISVGSLTRSEIVTWDGSLPMESWVTHLKVISVDLKMWNMFV